ncbi:MAG: helicase-related protein, partial [Tepidiformaceae bacterium]
VRIDRDTTRTKDAFAAVRRRVEDREVDILVGTQMLAKGLDLPAMTVVGVVDADVGLSRPDFSAHERTFQVLSQVAGRAGRREKAGSVFIQTYDPEAPPIVCAAGHDYRAFFEYEIAHRRRAGYPPFGRLARLLFHHGNDEHALQEAARVATDLRLRRDTAGRADPDILGPSRAFVPRLRGDYRWQIVLRGRDPGALIAGARLGERWAIDIDPSTLT